MRKILAIALLLSLFIPFKAQAASQDACAIWLCLPSGFPSGCGGAYSEFKHRVKKGKPPLPDFSSCSVDGKSNGSYQLGYEPFKPCESGYTLKIYGSGHGYHNQQGSCYANSCVNRIATEFKGDWRCSNYEAVKNSKPRYIKMWFDGQPTEKYYY